MEESILKSIKKLLGIEEDDTSFDTDIIININSALAILFQLGVGESAFTISDGSEVWSDFYEIEDVVSMCKTYIYLKTRLVFDPPASSAVMEAYKQQISEYEFRINVLVDPGVSGKE